MPSSWPQSARAVAIVQTKAAGNSNDVVSTLDSAITPGNTMIVIGTISHASQTLTISEDATTTWSQCLSLNSHSTSSIRIQAWMALATGATTAITMTSSGGANTSVYMVGASGLGAPSCDGAGFGEDSGTSHGGAIALSPSTTAETVIVGVVASSSSASFNSTPPTYTPHSGAPLPTSWGGYKVVTSTSANTFASRRHHPKTP
jgi:hypothetical protein